MSIFSRLFKRDHEDIDIPKGKPGVYCISRETWHSVQSPVAMFATVDECKHWIASQYDEAVYSWYYMPREDIISELQSKMAFGVRCSCRGCKTEEEANERIHEYKASSTYKRYEQWLRWLNE